LNWGWHTGPLLIFVHGTAGMTRVLPTDSRALTARLLAAAMA